MAKDKDRALNPAAAQRKLEKQKALKKGKATIQAQRTTRLAARNPHRLERQIADLKAQQADQGGRLNARETKTLEEAERDLARVKKAREAVGVPERGPDGNIADRGGGDRGRGGGGRGRGGKRGRDAYMDRGSGREREKEEEESEDTDDSVRKIPMPRDTPPPIPHRRQRPSNPHHHHLHNPNSNPNSNPNLTPISTTRAFPHQSPTTTTSPQQPEQPPPPRPAPQTIYSSLPQVRDLRREAIGFVPQAVLLRQRELQSTTTTSQTTLATTPTIAPPTTTITATATDKISPMHEEEMADIPHTQVPIPIPIPTIPITQQMLALRQQEEAFDREIRDFDDDDDDGGV